jgi:hypothetical protein
MEQFSAKPIRIVDSIAFSLTTGSAPGRAKQTGQVCVFGSAPKIVLQPQNIFEFVFNSTCTSSPSTGSYFEITSSYVNALMLHHPVMGPVKEVVPPTC